jgi:uncharacterized protein YndB with AHSA1/START domain
MNSDCIEKSIVLRAPLARVWEALSNSAEFGKWFGVKFDGPFAPGETLHGVMVPTTVDPDVAATQKEYEGMPFDIRVERVEPEKAFAFRWHPYPIEPGTDFDTKPTTLVTFTLEKVEEGVFLKVIESGFDGVPLERRAKAFADNEEGWGIQVTLIQKYLAAAV